MGKRAIVLVLDGFGVGAMADVEQVQPRDRGAHTLRSLAQSQRLETPNLLRLGLTAVAPEAGLPTVGQPQAAWGRCNLAHWGADTYAGHNEIQGNNPQRPVIALFSQVADAVRSRLQADGHRVEAAVPGGAALLVNGRILVGDNLETDPGRIYNVTSSLDQIAFEEILAVGQAVREVAKVSQVIALGGVAITVDDILRHTRTTGAGQTGVVTPELHIYNEHYRVRHLGHGLDPRHQAPSLVAAAGAWMNHFSPGPHRRGPWRHRAAQGLHP